MPSPKDFPPDTVAQRRCFLIAAGTSDYERLPKDAQLPSVKQDLERIRTLFCETLHYENALPDLKINPKREVFRKALWDWIRHEDRNESDVVVIYYSGHGDVEQDRHYLLTSESDPNDLLETAIATEDLARRVASSSVRLVLILIDTCYAGQGSIDIAKVVSGIKGLFSAENVGFFVIAAARPKEEARQGFFAEALTCVLNDERLAGVLQEFLLPISVSTAINRYFRDRNLSQLTMVHDSYVGYEDPPFFRNPRFQPFIPVGLDLQTQKQLSSMAPTDVLSHWGPRGRGVELGSQTGWYFTGRTRILRELVGWLKAPTSDTRAQVITGAPGVGKSAVLARLATIADPDFRRQAPLADVDPDTIPPEGCIDVAIHAKGKTIAEIVRAISTIAGVATADPNNLVRDLAGRVQPFTILIDALDEAKEPEAIAENLLQLITPLPTVRLLIGTRKGLLPRLGKDVQIKYLDGEYNEPADIRDYVKLRLLARDEPEIETPYRNKPDLVGQVAEAVAARAKTVFLIARLICENLTNAKEVVDPKRAEWRDELPTTVTTAFSEYLRRFGKDEHRVRDLLLPLAYAEGEGLPWDTLWASLVTALSGRVYTDQDVVWVRDKAGAYIIEALQSGQSVYRLYHQALADYFHDDRLDQERHRQIARALIASVPERESRKVWQEAHMYVLQHLSMHAARGGILVELVRDPLYLLMADPVRLLPAVNSAISSLPAEIIRVYKHTTHRLHDAPLEERASYLELNARKQQVLGMAEKIARLPLYRKWRPKWAAWRLSQTHTVLHGHEGAVSCVALGQLGGREVIVSGSSDETVRIWEASTGQELQALKGHESWGTSVALGQVGDREVVFAGCLDNTVRIWEASTGKELQALKGHEHVVHSIALGQVGGREVIVSGSSDNTVRVWEASTGKQLQALKGHEDAVHSVALGQIGGREVIVSASDDKTVRIWDASTGKGLQALKGHEDAVSSVALGQLGGRDVIVSGSWDETIRIWDASTGQELQALKGPEGVVHSVALGQLGGREVIVFASWDTVRIWDASTGKELETLRGHEDPVTSVALGQLGGRDVIVSGSVDKTVRIWEAFMGQKLQVLRGQENEVHSVALGQVGQEIIVSGSVDKTVRIGNASTGQKPFRGFENEVHCVALGQVGGREVIVSASEDKTIRIWEASTGQELQALRGHESKVISVALGRIGGREVIVSGSPDETVRIWDASTGKELQALKGNQDVMGSVALGRLGGREVIVSSGRGLGVRIWEASTGKELRVLKGQFLWGPVALGQLGGREVIVNASDDVRIWEASTGKELHVLKGHEHDVTAVALGQLGGREVIAAASHDKTVRIWEASTGKELHVLKGHEHTVTSIALGWVGGRGVIVSGSWDKTVRIWQFRPDELWTSIFLESPVSSVAVDGAYVAAGTRAGVVLLTVN